MAQCATENENDLAYVPIADYHITYSDAYRRLEQESTEQWHLGPVALNLELCLQ